MVFNDLERRSPKLKLGERFAQKSLSFTPGFSLVLVQAITQKPFQRFPAGKNGKPLKRFSALVLRLVTRLKPGVNDRDF
jgi:hypothetical protein